jgi:hypothetical protein
LKLLSIPNWEERTRMGEIVEEAISRLIADLEQRGPSIDLTLTSGCVVSALLDAGGDQKTSDGYDLASSLATVLFGTQSDPSRDRIIRQYCTRTQLLKAALAVTPDENEETAEIAEIIQTIRAAFPAPQGLPPSFEDTAKGAPPPGPDQPEWARLEARISAILEAADQDDAARALGLYLCKIHDGLPDGMLVNWVRQLCEARRKETGGSPSGTAH